MAEGAGTVEEDGELRKSMVKMQACGAFGGLWQSWLQLMTFL